VDERRTRATRTAIAQTVVDVQLVKQSIHTGAHGAGRAMQASGDLMPRLSLEPQDGDTEFASRQAELTRDQG
jgi:hypothetical protein